MSTLRGYHILRRLLLIAGGCLLVAGLIAISQLSPAAHPIKVIQPL